MAKKKSYYCSALQTMVRQDCFPKVNENGQVYIICTSDNDGDKKRILVDGGSLEEFISTRYPTYPLVAISNPSHRASLVKAKHGNVWNKQSIAEAVQEFMVPRGSQALFVLPEIFNRDELAKCHRYVVKDEGGKMIGIRPPCWQCKTNAFTKFKTLTVQNHKRTPKQSIGKDGRVIPLCGSIYTCKNPTCEVVTFQTWIKTSFELLPQQVQLKYQSFACGLGVAADKTTWATKELSYDLLDDRMTEVTISESLRRGYESLQQSAKADYYSFVISKGATGGQMSMASYLAGGQPSRIMWPTFDQDLKEIFARENKPPQEDAILKMSQFYFGLVQEKLQRDLLSRPPTRVISQDVTYELVGKTMNDPLSGENLDGASIVFDQYGRIISFNFTQGERNSTWERIHRSLYNRCVKHLRIDPSVVEYIYTDLGDENLNDPTKHYTVDIWPAVTKAPGKDLFHGMTTVTGPDSVYGPGHDLHIGFCQSLSRALVGYTESSIHQAVTEYREKTPSATLEMAKDAVLSTPRWTKKMVNFVFPRDIAAANVRKLFAKIRLDDAKRKKDAKEQKQEYRSYLKKPFKKQRGFEINAANFLKIIERGGFEDPFPPEEMSFPGVPYRDDGRLVNLRRIRGTSSGESSNKQFNAPTKSASRILAETGDRRAWLRVTRLNRDKDKSLEHITNKRALEPFWFLEEAIDSLTNQVAWLSPCGTKYPPLLHEYKEPQGLEFARTKNDFITESIHHHLANLQAVERTIETQEIDAQNNTQSLPESIPTQPLNIEGNPNSKTTFHFSAGATTWGRREGGRGKTALPNLVVSEPLTSVQEGHLLNFVDSVMKNYSGVSTDNQLAEKVRLVWNSAHLSSMNLGGTGLGGFMTMDIATDRIEKFKQTMLQHRGGPPTYQPMSFFPGVATTAVITPAPQMAPYQLIVPKPMIPGGLRSTAAAIPRPPQRKRPRSVATDPNQKTISRLGLKDLPRLTKKRANELVAKIRGVDGAASSGHERNIEILQAHIRSQQPGNRPKENSNA